MKLCLIRFDRIKGRGVYASEPIRRGELIEICELILVPLQDNTFSLSRYCFEFDNNHVAIALGNGSLYNHSDLPNATCYFHEDGQRLVFEARKTIAQGEEILINYGYSEKLKKKFQIVS